VELEICCLPASLNIPLRILHSPEQQETLKEAVSHLAEIEKNLATVYVYVLCKQGNDSQKAVQLLREQFCTKGLLSCENTAPQTDSKQVIPAKRTCDIVFKDIVGGLYAWAKHIDKDFPVY